MFVFVFALPSLICLCRARHFHGDITSIKAFPLALVVREDQGLGTIKISFETFSIEIRFLFSKFLPRNSRSKPEVYSYIWNLRGVLCIPACLLILPL